MAAVGDKDSYLRAEGDGSGDAMTQMVLTRLMKKEQKQGTSSSVYQTEEKFYQQVMEETFLNLMVSVVASLPFSPSSMNSPF